MPRPQQALGRAGTPVIPPGWQQAHGAVVAKTWTVGCEIRHPGGTKTGPLDPTTGSYPVTANTPHFSGNARVQALSLQDTARLVADQEITTAGYLVAVDLSADAVKVDDVVTIVTVPADADQTLVDRSLTVKSVVRGSLAWERDLVCIDNLG